MPAPWCGRWQPLSGTPAPTAVQRCTAIGAEAGAPLAPRPLSQSFPRAGRADRATGPLVARLPSWWASTGAAAAHAHRPCSLRLAEAGQLRGCRARHGCRAASGQPAYHPERGRQRAARGSALWLRSGRSALAHALLWPSVALLGREGWLRSLWRTLSGSRRCCGRLAAQEGPTAGPGGGEGSIGAHGAPRSAVPCSLPAR